ncbi:hypothetical protein [Dactylosporangium sp. NPDC050588]|uniref:hypothetical protein n=1 Tax=Dactylosporangium sp. NPDC050588 TaxID=3157211 RepID=UPI0033CA3FE3
MDQHQFVDAQGVQIGDHGTQTNNFTNAVYATTGHGAVALHWAMLPLYERLGGATGWLGFPTHGDADVQWFEGGVIAGDQAVPLAIYTEARELPLGPVRRLGDGADQAQFFDKGLVTVRDGVAEAWVQPPPVDFFKDWIS